MLGVHNELAFLPEPPGRETIYASQRFKGKKRPEMTMKLKHLTELHKENEIL